MSSPSGPLERGRDVVTRNVVGETILVPRYDVVRQFGVEVVLVEPGPIRTEFDRAGLTRLQAMEWPEDYEMDLRRYRKGLEAMLKTSPSPERTAKTIERAVFAARPRAIYRTTLFAKLAPFLGFALSPGIWDRLIRMQLSRQGPE